jgi:DNA-binding NarL/FixJ family response regulator
LPLGHPHRRHRPQNGLASAAFAEARVGPCRDIGIYRSLEPGFPPMPVTEYLFDNAREGKKPMTRILIADDHEVVRSGLRSILEAQPRWAVVGEACDGKEAVSKALETQPDVVLLDYSMPIINGTEATRQIRARLPRTEVLIFTMHQNDTLIQGIQLAGASGFLLKSDAKRHLIRAIESLAMHKPYFTESVSCAGDGGKVASQSPLTNRERSVVQLIAEGCTNKQIANVLSISPKTVETHRAAIMRKLALSSSASLVRYAVRNGILTA